jgi:hypothetical protein
MDLTRFDQIEREKGELIPMSNPPAASQGANMRPGTVSIPTIQGVMVGMVPSNQVSAASMNAHQRIPSIMPSFAAVAATPQDSYAAAAAKLAVPRGGSGSATITSAAMLAGPRGQFIPGVMDKSRQQHTMQYAGGSLAGTVKMPLAELNKMTHDQKKSELVGNLDQLTRLLRILREQVVSDKAGISAKMQRTSRSVLALFICPYASVSCASSTQ